MQAIQTQGAYFHPYCFQDSSHRFCMGTLLFPRSRQCCRVWYQGIYSESLPPWWFSMFLWIFKACAPKAHSVDALWMLVVCSLLCAECPLSSHRFGKLFHRAQGRKQKLHFFFFFKEKSKLSFKACGNWKDPWRLSQCNWWTCQRHCSWKITQNFKIKFYGGAGASCWEFFPLVVLAWRSIQGCISDYKSEWNDMGFCMVIWKWIIDILEAGA